MHKSIKLENTSNAALISIRHNLHYYPFGSTLPTRSWSDVSRAYRYGFNGKEKDSETANDNYDFGARIYDGRLGRWLSLDPLMKKYSGLSPFNYCANSVLIIIDPNGEDLVIIGTQEEFQKFKEILEAEFAGLVEIRRDENNKVTMHLRETEFYATGTNQEVTADIINKQKEKEAFIQLNNIITDCGTTSVKLTNNDPNCPDGLFRSQQANGKTQLLDIGDAEARKDWTYGSGAGAILHELVEAYIDQVVNSSPPASNQISYYKAFTGPHFSALASQAKVDGMDMQYNQNDPNQPDKVQIFFKKVLVSNTGEESTEWYLQEFEYQGAEKKPTITKALTKIKDVKITNNGVYDYVSSYTEEK